MGSRCGEDHGVHAMEVEPDAIDMTAGSDDGDDEGLDSWGREDARGHGLGLPHTGSHRQALGASLEQRLEANPHRPRSSPRPLAGAWARRRPSIRGDGASPMVKRARPVDVVPRAFSRPVASLQPTEEDNDRIEWVEGFGPEAGSGGGLATL